MRDARRFARQVVEVPPGGLLDHEAPVWREALVVVLDGEIVVECNRGEHQCFVCGDILTFARLPLRRVQNEGPHRARLLAVWRTGEPERGRPSHR
jgi:quercetin dioxygenase-like cupin family protein